MAGFFGDDDSAIDLDTHLDHHFAAGLRNGVELALRPGEFRREAEQFEKKDAAAQIARVGFYILGYLRDGAGQIAGIKQFFCTHNDLLRSLD